MTLTRKEIMDAYMKDVDKWMEDKKALDAAYKEAIAPINEAFNEAHTALWNRRSQFGLEYNAMYEEAEE